MEELRSVIQESWTKALLAAGTVEEHAAALVSGLGDLSQIGQKAALAPDQVRRLVVELAERMHSHRTVLAAEVERAVKSAVDRIRLPARSELAAMSEKLAALEARLGELEREGRNLIRKEIK